MSSSSWKGFMGLVFLLTAMISGQGWAAFSAGLGLGKMVGARGFEPPTPWSRTRCATRLRYAPTCVVLPPAGAKGERRD